ARNYFMIHVLHKQKIDDTSSTQRVAEGVGLDRLRRAKMRAHMREQNYLDRARLNPARAFKTPMDVVETDDIDPAAKLAILKAWEADERALLRAEDEGMGRGEHAHLQ